MDVSVAERRWLLLMGAMIGNKSILAEAVKKLTVNDVPAQHKELWTALKMQNAESIRKSLEGYGVERHGDSASASLVKTLQGEALHNYVKAAMGRASHAGLLDAERAAEFLEKMAVEIRARQEALK